MVGAITAVKDEDEDEDGDDGDGDGLKAPSGRDKRDGGKGGTTDNVEAGQGGWNSAWTIRRTIGQKEREKNSQRAETRVLNGVAPVATAVEIYCTVHSS